MTADGTTEVCKEGPGFKAGCFVKGKEMGCTTHLKPFCKNDDKTFDYYVSFSKRLKEKFSLILIFQGGVYCLCYDDNCNADSASCGCTPKIRGRSNEAERIESLLK